LISGTTRWRRHAIELAEELHRLQGCQAPRIDRACEQALQVSLRVDGRSFLLLHVDPEDSSGQLLLQSCFGRVPDHRAPEVFRQALTLNQGLARNLSGMFTLDVRDSTLVYSLLTPMTGLSAPSLLESMRQIAALALDWQRTCPGDLQ